MVTGHHNPFSLIIFPTLSAIITIYAAAAYLRMLQKGSTNSPPAIIIDDAGLWSWRDGLMPWSEIQPIKWKAAGGKRDVRYFRCLETSALFLPPLGANDGW
jgi:hypothetical protein